MSKILKFSSSFSFLLIEEYKMLTFELSPSVLPGLIDREDYERRLSDLKRELEEGCTPFQSDDYQGHMNFDVSKAHLDALKLGLSYNQNNIARESAPVTLELERQFICDIASDFGYDPEECCGIQLGTISNIEGICIGRNKARKQGEQPKYVLAAEDAHYSISKACDILGLEMKHLEECARNFQLTRLRAAICGCCVNSRNY
jgi:glutamate/tyrosine decarboxylase-like PLP-dependent enzyme